MADFGSKEITPDIAGQVLWHYTGRGRVPGSFAQALLVAIIAADPQNRARLKLGFPGYVAAVQLVLREPNGMDELHRIAAGETT